MSDDIKKGLMGVVVDVTGISKVMPEINSLTYRGYAAQDLCAKCKFEEVAYLILNGDLPNSKELKKFEKEERKDRKLSKSLIKIIKEMPRKSLKSYLLANMTEFGKTKLLNYKDLENLGYNIVIYPVTTQRLAMKNVEDGLRAIFADGHQNNIIDKMQTRKRLYEIVEYEKYNSLDENIYNFKTEGHE